MKLLHTIPLFATLFFFSCNKEGGVFPDALSWETCIPRETIIRKAQTDKEALAELSLVRNADCEAADVTISMQIRANGETIYTRTITEFPFNESISVPGQSLLTIESSYNENVISHWYCVKDPTISGEFRIH